MKVLLLKDVYKLGRAGDVKRVANGFGRNYLIPQGLAVLATQGALNRADRIKADAAVQRKVLNEEMSIIADQLAGVVLTFSARASETDKLYGSITTQMIAESISEKIGVEISRRQIDSQPLRVLGEHKVQIRLTVDLVPEITVIVRAEGEEIELPAQEIAEELTTELEGFPADVEDTVIEDLEVELPQDGEAESLVEEDVAKELKSGEEVGNSEE